MLLCRRATAADVDLFREIRLQALQDSPEAFGSTYESAIERSQDSWREQLVSTVDGGLRNTQFVFDGDSCVGLGALYREDGSVSGDLIMMWISPEVRSSGAGSMIVDNLLLWAGNNGFKSVSLVVTDSNTRGIKFYENCGFRNTGEIVDVDLSRGLKGIRMLQELS